MYDETAAAGQVAGRSIGRVNPVVFDAPDESPNVLARQSAEQAIRGSQLKDPNGRSELATALAQQQKLVAVLNDTIAQLESKLTPVFAPMPSTSSDTPGLPPCSTQIGSCITENSHSVLVAIGRLQTLIRGIQI